MSTVISLQPQTSKVIPLQSGNKSFSVKDFRNTYGDQTTTLFLQFLDTIYQQYTQSAHWQALSFRDQVERDYQFQLLRNLIKHLGGSNHR